ncbi:hypothetical protein [Adhaeribacter aquaticus]|uniref:hypothetical protein n=1 Tax=Adhaeribacter aquaticus TaxID=299567 RepID=UPI0004795B19|nr:hypothetical protein [Adhaeribacter aquaticus]
MKNPGKLLMDSEGNKYIAYNAKQHKSFADIGKVHVCYLEPNMKPKKDAEGKMIVGLKAIDKLTVIGFVD